MGLLSGGLDYVVNPSGPDILDFDLAKDRLDFGDTSVHGLILGKLADGSAVIVNPWQESDYQRVFKTDGMPLRWDEITLDNIAAVGNEHLRADIGGVLSWENGVGPIDSDGTVYIRSHEYGVQERIEGFDPQSNKLSFLYLGTRERLSAEDTDEGLLITVQPSQQSVLLVGVTSSELLGRNLEFHFDQIEEDNLEAVFGFQASDLSLVDRTVLLTPEAPVGATTDGFQTRLGRDVTSSGLMSSIEATPMHESMHGHESLHDTLVESSGQLILSASGSLYWGGMSGQLTITNSGATAVENWQVSFETPHADFQSWAGDAHVEQLDNGQYRVTLSPAAWNGSIAAGSSITVGFNAVSTELPNSGELTSALFFTAASTPQTGWTGTTTLIPPAELIPEADSNLRADVSPQEDLTPEVDLGTADVGIPSSGQLILSASGSLYWGGMSGQLTITNSGATAVENWQVSFETPHADFQSWAGDAHVEQLDNGQYRVTLSPAAWNGSIAAGSSITVGFNAVSTELPNSGELTSALFFTADSTPQTGETSTTTLIPPAELIPQAESNPQEEVTLEEDLTPDAEPVADPVREQNSGNRFSNGKRMVAYFEEWGIYSRDYLVQDIPVGELTHINYSFFDVKANGDVTLFDPWAATDKRFTAAEQVSRTFSAGAWSELSEERRQVYSASHSFETRIHEDGSVSVTGIPVGWENSDALAGNLGQLELLSKLYPDVNLGIALGGWTLSDEFSLALDDASGRDVFTDNLIATLKDYDFFNTIDFDWEYPGGGGLDGNASSSQDGVNFAATLQLLRQKLDLLTSETGERYEVSVATAGGAEKLANLNLVGIDPYVDFYNVMAYDFHGGWEDTTGHQAAMTGDPGGYDVVTAVDQFRQNGIALEKVVLGAPAYTRAWGDVSAVDRYGLGQAGSGSVAPGSFEAGNYDQKDLITGIVDNTYDLIWDDDAKAAFAYDDTSRIWSSVETAATVAGKAAYVNEAGLGGMMFWALSNDAVDDQSLITAASDVLSGSVSAEVVSERGPDFDAVLGGDGAFSITDFTGLA